MNKKKKVVISKSGCCPKCYSKNLKYNKPTYDNDYMYVDCDCLNCGSLLNEQYKINFIGTLILNRDFSESWVDVGTEITLKDTDNE